MIPLPPVNSEEFHDPDFHATESCAPAMHVLGMIAIDWSMCEHSFGTLIWIYVGDVDKGYAVTAALGNQSRADLLFELVKKQERSKAVIERLEFASKCFNILRETRNSLMHSHMVVPHKSGKLEWVRQSNNKPRVTSCLADMDDLIGVHVYIGLLFCFINDIQIYFLKKRNGAKRPPLPEIFPLPSKLIQPRPAKQQGARRQLRSSRKSRQGKRQGEAQPSERG